MRVYAVCVCARARVHVHPDVHMQHISVLPGGRVMVEALSTQDRGPLLAFTMITLWVHACRQVANANLSNF